MADIKKVLEIEVDAKTGEIKVLNQEIEKTNKGVKKAEKGTSGMAKAWRKVGTALKAAGIGLLVAGLAKVTELFSRNQAVVDGFTTSMNALSIAFNDFFSFISDNVGTVIEYYKSVFEDPQTALQNFGKRIKEEVLNRFKQMAESAGFLGRALKKLFSGDFSGAWDDAQEAARQAVDVITGEDGGIEAITSGFNRAVGAIKEYTKETFAQGQAINELNKNAELAEVRQQGLIEKYDREAELLRQVRDETNNTFAERIAANEELGRVLDKQAEEERELIKLRQRALEENFRAGLIAEQEYLVQREMLANEEAEIEARITGFKSEQLINRTALANEQLAEELEIIKKRDAAERKFLEDQRKRDYDRQQSLKTALDNINDQEEADAKTREELQKQVYQTGADLLVAFSSLTDGESKKGFQIQKAASIAQATTSTILATIEAFKTAAASPLGIVNPSYPFIQAGAAAAFGAVNIAKIAATQYQGGGGGASSTGRSGGGGGQGAPAVNFNTVGGSGINQLNESIVAQNNTVKAYVVSSEVSSAQSLDRNRQSNATFG